MRTVLVRKYALALLIIVAALSGCSRSASPGDKSGEAESSSGFAATGFSHSGNGAADQKASGDMKTGVLIDWDELKDPLLNDEIKQLLRDNLEAWVRQDEAAYRDSFKNVPTADAFMYLFGGEVSVTSISDIKQEGKNIMMRVEGKRIRENEISSYSMYYYFNKDGGSWGLAAID
ncbi:hypothetical protein [Paenibacillus caui]|uniref:hypothetical protein n=1 Tax=Paenibacillus caui TaxID=2873927 RepID=UPI001CA8CE52|nr:hypothetical protein [Paenibacillus caui]